MVPGTLGSVETSSLRSRPLPARRSLLSRGCSGGGGPGVPRNGPISTDTGDLRTRPGVLSRGRRESEVSRPDVNVSPETTREAVLGVR